MSTTINDFIFGFPGQKKPDSHELFFLPEGLQVSMRQNEKHWSNSGWRRKTVSFP
jgi:hypothetical protein